MKKKSSNPVMLISVVLAVALWLVATLFDDPSRWLPRVPATPRPTGLPAPRDDSPLRVNTDRLSCQQAEAEIVAKVEDSRHCVRDEDCTLFDFGYPIQCLTSVSGDSITALRLEYRRYEASCEYRVYYDCPSDGARREAVCRNNRCEVDLVTDDVLQDLTLHHLGIDNR